MSVILSKLYSKQKKQNNNTVLIYCTEMNSSSFY